ncbi:amino acid transporter [Trichodelitschia bisporula]|uniref:Amino acid transporter n=1 Tax=Trichodelitschia bisporula TaxID=703511 RepID=A0A6G1I7A0_9PEZI|nr:amino acid transporter [Trichodelitschia bisporula]
MDPDAANLASMGYTPTLRRHFSLPSILGLSFSLTNSWYGISAALATGINSGGPVLLTYGIVLVALVSVCVGVSLAELASAMPNAGGQYFWASELAPRRWARGVSYAVGWCACAGAVFTSASVALASGSALVGCWALGRVEFLIRPWHVFLGYQVVNFACFWINCWGRLLPRAAQVSLAISLLSFLVILITVPSVAPRHQSAKFVFATFINNTGWRSDGLAYIVGLVNTNWAFACLDAATHLAEEVHAPERMVPIAILSSLGIGFITSWFFSIGMFFSIQDDFNSIVNTPTGLPILELFYRALGSRAGAICLEMLVVLTGLGCLVACHTWQSRLVWSFARDRGVPGHRWLSSVDERAGVPVWAHVASCTLVAVVGCVYLGSSTALNSLVTACIVLLYTSYSIPVICLLLRGRANISHGPFWLGRVGFVCNCVLLAWTLFTIVMYSFPFKRPVHPGNMNYVAAVYVGLIAVVAVDWVLRGKSEYRGCEGRKVPEQVR